MANELEAKAKVALDLLAQGAEEISITGTDIKVVRKSKSDHAQEIPTGNTVINVNTSATARSSVNISAQFSIVKKDLRRAYETLPRWPQLKKKIDQFFNI